MTVNRVVEDGENYLVYGNHGEESRALPKALLEAVEVANAFEVDVADALWFHRIVKDSPEYKWVKAIDLLQVNLTGWELYFAEVEGGYNNWGCVKLPKKISYREDNYFETTDALRQISTLYIGQEDMVLIVKLTTEEHAARLAREIEAFEEWRKRIAKMDSANLAQAQQDVKSEDALEAWVRELGIQAGSI